LYTADTKSIRFDYRAFAEIQSNSNYLIDPLTGQRRKRSILCWRRKVYGDIATACPAAFRNYITMAKLAKERASAVQFSILIWIARNNNATRKLQVSPGCLVSIFAHPGTILLKQGISTLKKNRDRRLFDELSEQRRKVSSVLAYKLDIFTCMRKCVRINISYPH